MLTEHGARRLLATEYVLGQAIRIGKQYFQVIGVVQSERAGGEIQTPDRAIDAYELSGFADVEHLVIAQQDADTASRRTALVTFDGPRRGLAAWLAERADVSHRQGPLPGQFALTPVRLHAYYFTRSGGREEVQSDESEQLKLFELNEAK